MNFEQLFQMAILAVIALVYWWSFRSFPPGQTADLIDKLADASKHTQTKVDDILVEIARLLNELRQERNQTQDGP